MPTLEVLLPAFAAGLIAIAVTVAIERWGGRTGGLIGTLPSTIVPFALGAYGDGREPEAFRQALLVVPAGMLLNACFLYQWRVWPARLPPWSLGARLVAMVLLSLTVWGLGAAAVTAGLLLLRRHQLDLLPLALALWLTATLLGALACRGAVPAPRGLRRVGAPVLLARGLLAGGAIGVACALKGSGSPLVAGMAAVFPAIYLTTMVALWLAQGEAVPLGAVGPMMLGSTSVSAFALLASVALPAVGPWPGCILAWVGAALLVTLPANLWLHRTGAPFAADPGKAP